MGYGLFTTDLAKSGSDLARSMVTQYSKSSEELQATIASAGETQSVADDSDPKRFETLKSKAEILTSFSEMLDFVKEKYSEKSSQLTTLLNVAADAHELAALNSTDQPMADKSLRSKVEGLLSLVQTTLNRSHNGQKLFSGTDVRSDSVVDLIQFPTPATGDPCNANYALDNGKDVVELVRPDLSINDPIRASDMGIQKLIHGLKLLQTAGTQPIDSARFSQAITSIHDSIQDLTSARAKVNMIENRLSNEALDMKKENIEVERTLKNHGFRDMYDMIRELFENNGLVDISRRLDMMMSKDLANTARLADGIV